MPNPSVLPIETSSTLLADVPRLGATALRAALLDSPVVLIHGPRQCGKTTLARQIGRESGHAYISFDDDAQRASALADPVGFVADLPLRVILDEVQRVPALFTSLKAAVDQNRSPGRFILTGSSNVLLLPKLADSLAGRMEILRLHPFAQLEIPAQSPSAVALSAQVPVSNFMQQLRAGHFEPQPAQEWRLGAALAERIAAGGYPAALNRKNAARRRIWYRDYIQTLVQRDVRDLARIQSLDAMPRLLSLAAGQTARLINVMDLAAPFQLSRVTVREYVNLLAQVFLLEELPPWFSNRLSRLIKTPKLHLTDTGVACALLGLDGAALWADRDLLGQMLETFVLQELRRLESASDEPSQFFHLRDKDGVEVDIVMQSSQGSITGIEVKASATVSLADFKGLRKFQASEPERFSCGLLIYDGDACLRFGPQLYAVPVSRLLA